MLTSPKRLFSTYTWLTFIYCVLVVLYLALATLPTRATPLRAGTIPTEPDTATNTPTFSLTAAKTPRPTRTATATRTPKAMKTPTPNPGDTSTMTATPTPTRTATPI